jgi:competence protein ComEC
VSLVSFGKFEALLTGDMPPDVSDKLAEDWSEGPVDYIKIPHHGSKNGLTDNLLKVIMPRLAVISVGKNTYGHPSNEILEMLEKNGIKYLRTDKEGDIEVITDGKEYWIK